MDRLSSMAVFVKVVEAGSFAAAADALGLSAPMVGKHVRMLEDHLGVRLINRTTRRQSLTDTGRCFYERCKTVLMEVEAAESCAAESQAAPRGRLRVNAPVTFGAHCLAPVLPEYLRAYPEVSVDLSLNDRIVDVIEEGYDAVVRVGVLTDSTLIARPLAPYRLVACAAPSYLAKHGAPSSPADLGNHECLGFVHWAPRGSWEFKDANGAKRIVNVAGRLTTNNGQALRAAALAGFGIILQPNALVADDLEAGRLVRVLLDCEPPSRPMHILFAPDERPGPKLRSFVDFMVKRFG
ncbi:MAG: LysR family transcriptional regulator [Mesorhizobium sp.]|uniref:LysR family transcriptional regulator n=1 Tax=Mesorhizobium sp. TaxID=1871066 RepID=UPI0012249963|nr:LysR family transcriptional regulator [Mesorhizobium sp.]TIS53500.1 MAG: LysR family transcriptional regulator [Mesorhizobium sp.]TIS86443.1 MAG: LysR family transcriptional regulator [Mesorhizobium sp.]TJW03089.1 MAG: LysR family transcriptional regulator [Mesorhizobium sp.]